MKSKWCNNWNTSVKPRKQRKYIYNAPLHIRKKLVSSHLSKELIKKYGIRSLPLRKGDKVIIAKGQFKKLSGKVEKINLKKLRVFVENIKIEKNDGTMAMYPLSASNLIITALNLEDKKRIESIKRKGKKAKGGAE